MRDCSANLVEIYLHDEVRSGKMTLPEAQKEIAVDRYAVYLQVT